MKKKYILTDETKTLDNGVVVHRIKAIRPIITSRTDSYNVQEGELGGWIEKEGK